MSKAKCNAEQAFEELYQDAMFKGVGLQCKLIDELSKEDEPGVVIITLLRLVCQLASGQNIDARAWLTLFLRATQDFWDKDEILSRYIEGAEEIMARYYQDACRPEMLN